jgi:hypothetical protein
MLAFIHTVLSLVGIITGLVVGGGLAGGRLLNGWAIVFWVTTVATNATGFLFPFGALLPSHIIGVLSLAILVGVFVAQYVQHLSGRWRRTYSAGVVIATYFNTFILVVQLFRRLPALIALAPTQSEPPFALTQGLVLVLFVWLGIAADRGFRTAAA